jgi:tRNA threonylcarbamoyladenosine biosynthesis protein TsaE
MLSVTLTSPAQTRRFARALAALLAPPALVTVEGDLGTGKTTLIREVLRARGVRGAVASPSFTIAQSYRGRGGERLHHLDLYRLSAGAETELFAWDDYLGGDALTFVEWPAAGREALPPADVRLALEHRTRASRDARLWASPALEERVAAVAAEAGVVVDRAVGERSASDGDTPVAAAPVAAGHGAPEHVSPGRAAADGTAGREAP